MNGGTLTRVFNGVEGRRQAVIAGAVVFQVAVLLILIGWRLMALAAGETVLLQVIPIDPRDLMRGEYVILNYEFSRLPSDPLPGLPEEPQERRGRAVFVPLRLAADGRHHTGGEFLAERPEAGLYLEGQIVGRNRIQFGIDSYFVEEGQGKRYEDAIRQGTVSARVSISRGKGSLVELVISPSDGEAGGS